MSRRGSVGGSVSGPVGQAAPSARRVSVSGTCSLPASERRTSADPFASRRVSVEPADGGRMGRRGSLQAQARALVEESNDDKYNTFAQAIALVGGPESAPAEAPADEEPMPRMSRARNLEESLANFVGRSSDMADETSGAASRRPRNGMLRRSKEYVGDILDSVGNGVGISKARRSSLSKRDSASVGLGGCGAGSRRIADGSRRPTEPLKEEDGELGSSFKKTTPEPPAASPSTSSPEALRPKAEVRPPRCAGMATCTCMGGWHGGAGGALKPSASATRAWFRPIAHLPLD
eukprot:7386264-Prymnesium_polylepis.1